MSGSGDQPLAPKGRGAFLTELLRKRQLQEQQEESDASTSASVPVRVGRGRASNIEKLRQLRDAEGGTSQSQPRPPMGRASALLEKLAATHISQPPTPESTKSKSPPQTTKRQVYESVKETEPVIKRAPPGKTERVVPATANYIRLKVQPGKGVFEYEVRFNPIVDSVGLKSKMLNEYLQGGARTFDGIVLYLPKELPQPTIVFEATHPIDQSKVEISIIYKRKKRLGECIHLYNVMFRRIFKFLHYIQIGRQNYDPKTPHKINQHKLEIWPGYVTAVDEYEGGVMLCIDCSHRVLRTDTVRTFLTSIISRTWHQDAQKTLVGCSVLTKYNNKIYRIDDIIWDQNPQSTFATASGDEISYVDYYNKHYGLKINDLKQPLLVHRATRRLPQSSEKVDQLVCLIPEFCYMTGLTDDMRNNFTLMKDVATYTRITPNQRIAALNKFIANVRNCPEAVKLLDSWGLELADGTIDLEMRILAPETIVFGGGAESRGTMQADWTRAATTMQVISAVDLINWYLIHTPQDKRNADTFKDMMLQISGPMGIRVTHPTQRCLKSDATGTYSEELNKIIRPDVQILVFICPTMREDRYNTIKKITLAEKPIPTQVINSRTLSNPKKLRTVVQKIALQINCKLGGQLWSVKLPRHQWMICGIDTYHDAQKLNGKSVAGFVASLNQQITRWYSQVNYQSKGEELLNALQTLFTSALKKYFDVNGDWPSNIIIYRDGVGDGQLKYCAEYEIAQLKEAMKTLGLSLEKLPKLTFVVVQKRINTRLFLEKGESDNPPAGSVMDHTVTRRDWYDFFLVSQHVRQGTVSPTHYVVLHDNSQFSVEQVQKLTYKMCHLYYNWSGTIRVPAPCQYAHKLAYLIGQNVHKVPSEKLADRLYYL